MKIVNRLLCAVVLLFGISEIIECAESSNEIQKTLDFLQNGERNFKLDRRYRDVVMMIGNTGTGKSTLVRFIAGNLAESRSVRKGNNFVIDNRHNGIIGNSTTRSQTIYPDLVVDDENIAFYDCPGFSDTRNISIEIAATYFTKKVVDHAENLKLILAVNYNDIIIGGSRDQFPLLIKHMKYFVRNLSEYKSSIGLVATKVSNEFEINYNSPAAIPDDSIKESIAAFLEEYRKDLTDNRNQEATDNGLSEYSIELIDILLTKNDNGIYEKLALFRKPTASGNLNELPDMVNGRRNIRQMILKQVAYSPKIANNFGYTISDTSKVKLIQLTNEINRKISEYMEHIGSEIKTGMESYATRNGNLKMLANRYHMAHQNATAIVNNAHDNTTIVPNLMSMSHTFDLQISDGYLRSIDRRINYIDFLQIFADERLPVDPSIWVRGFNDCTDYLEENQNWYIFLNNIYDAHSQYEFRRELDKYNVSDLDDWGHADRPQGIHINRYNFRQFAEKQNSPVIIKRRPNIKQLKTLNNLLKITIRQRPTVTCENDNAKMIVKGDYICLRDIRLDICGNQLKSVFIFALHTVYIDADLTTGARALNVSILATRWYVWGDHRIKLSGADAGNVRNEAAKIGTVDKAGAAGVAGLPGGSTGNFLGLGMSFVMGDRLEIHVVGGKGGRGQDGGAGITCSEPDVTNIASDLSDTGEDELRQKSYRKIEDITVEPADRCTVGVSPTVCKSTWYVYGNCNGPAGNGGSGGLGGSPGYVKIIALAESALIRSVIENGALGANGKGGPISLDIPKKIKMTFRAEASYIIFIKDPSRKGTWTRLNEDDDYSCPMLNAALDGANTAEIIQPEKPYYLDPYVPTVEFEAYIRENLVNPLKRDDLIAVLKLMSKNENILTNYTAMGFVSGLQLLEEQFYRLHNEVDLSFAYQSAADGIEKFAALLNVQQIQLAPEELKVLHYLYTAAWGKYITLSAKEPDMIIDIQGNLDLTIGTIQRVTAVARRDIIDETRKSYRQELDAKINEATGLINGDILPAIQRITGTLDTNLETLVNETIDRRRQSEIDLEKYRKDKAKIQSQMAIRALLGVVNVASQFGACLGPYGMAASAVASGVSQIGEGLLGTTTVSKVIAIPAAAKTVIGQVGDALKKYREDKMKMLDGEIRKLNNRAKDDPVNLADIQPKIDNLKERLNQPGTSSGHQTIENELNQLLATKQKGLESKKSRLTEVGKETLRALGRTDNVLKVAQSGFEMYKKYAADQDKMDEIGKAIDETKMNIQIMRDYEKKVHDIMWPMVDEMRSNINKVEQSLAGNAQPKLTLKKWQVQSMLRETKYQLQKMTKGFDAQEDLLRTIENINDAFTTLITIYDCIDHYQDQEKLGDFIANIGSADFNKILVNDVRLQSALTRLDLVITSNVLLTQYSGAIDGFKHTIFPFAGFYLDQFQLPSNLHLGNDTTSLVTVAVNQLTGLQSRLFEYNQTKVNGNDAFIEKSKFDIGLESTEPFYDWLSENNREAIGDLMAGKLVTFYADVRRSPPQNAIKFNEIALKFRTQDAGRQAEINSLLTKFKVTLIHMGNSHYRCGSAYYLIHGPQLNISYTFERNDGSYTTTSVVYDKIRDGNLILSPYTMWKIYLKNVSRDERAIQKLSALSDRVDLILTGRGQSVTQEAPICNAPLDRYYQRIDLGIGGQHLN